MALRKRELQLYDVNLPLKPESSNLTSSSSLWSYLPRCDATPDTSRLGILTSLAQLTALQLSAPRAVISLCDCKSQYVVAETPASDRLRNQGERICDKTTPCDYAMSAFVEGDRIFFVVFDLAQDSRFEWLCEPPLSGSTKTSSIWKPWWGQLRGGSRRRG